MEWLDSSGTILPADGPPERHRDSEGLYTVRRHVTVNQTDTNRFTCRVQQQEINHMKETEIHVPGSSEVQVVGPADPVVALAGDDIILPCSLKPNVNAENMVVRWTRLNLKSEVVHRYSDGRDSNVDQSPSYRNRTSVFNEELKNGNVSLKLTRVTLSDAGSYRCFIPTLTSQVKNTTVQLFVGAVSQPVISIDGTKDWGVVLKCESGGWFPEPEMEWLDSSGTILPADGPPERHRDSECLYSVRRHVTVDQTDTNRFTCRVHQKEINHLKETEIHVPDDVFPKSQVGLIVGLLIAAAVGVIAALVGVYMLSKHNEDDVFPKLQLGLIVGLLLAAVGLLAASAGVFGVYMWRKHTEEEEQSKGWEEQIDARFVTRHKDHLIQKVSGGKSIASELHQKDLIPDEMNCRISAAGTSQDQMRLLYEALEEAEDTTRVKSTFYKILLDLEPDVVKDLKVVTRERDELKEELRKAKETIQSLSTSPGGQQKTQTPSQKSERIEGMEMESLPGRKSGPGPGRKSAPEMKPLLAAGPQKEDLYDLERGGRDTTEFNYRETIPSGRKSGPEKEMEMKPLLGPGPQKDDLDELERGGRVTTEFNYVL
ncbi:uncharacterized protein [Salmo salar]|uniref:Butyrophilin-like protein 2 n=1 Tax=Salmo salar TaxID=8030 RepID=A0ABM3E9G0_SALSA|nr:uncharacterized protein LOC123732527 [Salmo salar]